MKQAISEKLLTDFYTKTITKGSLEVIFASGSSKIFGDNTGVKLKYRFTSRKAQIQLLIDPLMKAAELYVNGDVILENGDLKDLLILYQTNAIRRKSPLWMKIYIALRYGPRVIRAILPWDNASKNAAHHYDLSTKMYKMFLDEDLQYTCAYYEHEKQSLYDAQRAKKRHVMAKLMIKPKHEVLELGCGWGGLALQIAEISGANVTAVNLSTEQIKIAQERAIKRGLEDKTDFLIQDCRDSKGQYDRIVSIGMLEHIGKGKYNQLFNIGKECLKKDGVMVVHAICRNKPAIFQSPWSDKYIFPGAYVPALSEVLPAIEKAGLLVKDIEILAKHYGHTCRDWRANFNARKDDVIELLDEKFYRMWDLYLAGSEISFTHAKYAVFQIQIVKRHDALPITRDYLDTEKERLKSLEKKLFNQDI